jgi:LmbE family N-acetylglucosaminyl deacetylase
MTFHQPRSDLYIPDSLTPDPALARTTHLGIGAHQDDLEFMAFHGILAGYKRDDTWFSGVTCTNGAGSSRTGPFAACSDADMQEIRREEQRRAARIGHYAAMIQLDYPSSDIKTSPSPHPEADLLAILRATRPRVVYTHNPADKHETHIGVLKATLRALRQLPPAERPQQLLGCEVWRDLDWLPDEDKTLLDVSGHDDLAQELNSVFASQIAGGKRYDLAIQGRRRANATFFQSHSVDGCQSLCFAIDLTPLLKNDALTLADFMSPFLQRFRDDVLHKLTP